MGTVASSAPAAPKGAVMPADQSQSYGGVNSPFMSPSQVSNFLAPLPQSPNSMAPALGSAVGSMPGANAPALGSPAPAPAPWGMVPTGGGNYGIPQTPNGPAPGMTFGGNPPPAQALAGAAQQLGSAVKAAPIAGAAQQVAGALGQAQQQMMPGAPMARPAMGGMYQRMAGLRR